MSRYDVSEISDAAFAVHANLRNAHRECDVAGCPFRSLWVEDVQEILEAFALHLRDNPTDPASTPAAT